MYPSRFDYSAPDTLDEVLFLLQQHAEDAKLLAGGQSLIPLMKLRFAAPPLLIDNNRVPDLAVVLFIVRSNGRSYVLCSDRWRRLFEDAPARYVTASFGEED